MPTHDAVTGRAAPRRLAGLAVVLAVLFALVPGAFSAAAAPSPSADQPIWAMNQGGNMLAGFERSDYNEQDGSPRQTTAPDGRAGLQFQLEPGDKRSELEPDTPNQVEGQVQWYTYSAQLAPDFPTDVDTWQLLLQWHHQGDSGSPPVAVEVRGNRLEIAAEGEDFQDLGPIKPGDEINLTLRILFSRDSGKGTVDVWRDGRHALKSFKPSGGTLLDDYNYLKVGYYRDDGIDEFGRLWLHDLRIGPTLDSVRDADSPAAQIPREDDPEVTPPAEDDSSNASLWIGGGLLAVVLLVGAAFLARRRDDTRV